MQYLNVRNCILLFICEILQLFPVIYITDTVCDCYINSITLHISGHHTIYFYMKAIFSNSFRML